MPQIDFRRLSSDALIAATPLESDEALALASSPGGCEGQRFPVFVELDSKSAGAFAVGEYAGLEFILPGKPGQWKAAGQVTMMVNSPRPDAPFGIGIELLGLALAPGLAPEVEAATEVEAAPESGEASFDLAGLLIELDDVSNMLADLLGREVDPSESTVLETKIKPFDIAAGFRDDDGEMIFAIILDKAAAAYIGGSLTMMPEANLAKEIKARKALEGEPLENAGEVLNIMSALFHDAGSPHVVLAETCTGGELAGAADGSIQAIVNEPSWSLCLAIDIEEYGVGEVLLLAK